MYPLHVRGPVAAGVHVIRHSRPPIVWAPGTASVVRNDVTHREGSPRADASPAPVVVAATPPELHAVAVASVPSVAKDVSWKRARSGSAGNAAARNAAAVYVRDHAAIGLTSRR